MSILCAVLFFVFSFVYICVFQGELLALMQDYLSSGVTKNNAIITAFIISILLALLQWVINRYSKLHNRWEALSYIPSCMLLALVTDVNDGTMLYSASKWLWGIPLCVVLYVVVVWLNRMTFKVSKLGFFGMLWPNLLTFTVLFILTAHFSNHAPAPHMELAAWRYMHDDRYEDVIKVGANSDDYNKELTALRNLALLKLGKSGEMMFHYPQSYGADGLIYNRHNKQSVAYGAEEFYRHMGVEPYGGESGRAFATRMYMKSDSVIYRDLYLAALLLDKDLDAFASVVSNIAVVGDTLPIHYQEALILYKKQHPASPVLFEEDSITVSRFDAYCSLKSEHEDNDIVAKNLCKRKFGKTYWWYYDFKK